MKGNAQEITTALLYQTIEPLEARRHLTLGILDTQDYSFARSTHIVPLTAVEFVQAARHYPIVFNADDTATPVALVGVESRRNVFIESNGDWAEGCYLPAFIRRYPFILLKVTDAKGKPDIQLCIDRAAPQLSEQGGKPLFDAETHAPTQLLEKIGRFNADYHREQARTRRFIAACKQHDLFVPRSVDFETDKGEHLQIKGFLSIDDRKLQTLPDDVVVDWWRKGYLPLALAHFSSLGNFGRLIHRFRRLADQA